MDIKKITEIVNSHYPSDIKELQILDCLSKDEEMIPMLLDLLQRERDIKRGLIEDMNLELSRAHIYIEERPETAKEQKQNLNKNFVVDCIAKFYFKYAGIIKHCFNRFN